MSWIYHRFPRLDTRAPDVVSWPLAERLIGFQPASRDQQEGRMLRWRSRLDRSTLDQFRWTPYDVPGIQALIPNWMRSAGEVYTWRFAVPVVCFNYVHMHHIERVIRQYGGEQPIPRAPVDVTRWMNVTARGDDVWWPHRLATWYAGWMRRGTKEVMVSVHAGDPRGTQEYFGWYLHAVRPDRFLSREEDLLDPRWNIPPPDIPAAAAHERDDLVMPGDEPAPRRRVAPEPRPRQAALARGKLTRRDQRRRARMLVAGAAAHLDEERAEEQQEYDRQEETGHDQYGEGVHDHHSDEAPGVHETGQHAGDAADPRISPSTMISFSPLLQPKFQPHSQEQTGLDELFHMNACPTDEFTSIAGSFRMSRAQHFYQGASSSHPPAPLPPASHETAHHVPWVPTYSSPPVIGYPVFDPTRIGSDGYANG
ncbi:hypothetical protein PIB30_082847 [Stylosanthes scabra]|uniref:Aminotransferase-like plant mobile domain-containing protein n=1 Tax=Stylosanthes scabra TaxID=79078 RepID=A0ABU6QSX7_9FABA|nr:hypothetical protein [Stylosanthes scabra]